MLSSLLTTIFHLDVTGTNLAVVYSPLLKRTSSNRKQDLESKLIEILSVEITVKKGKWMVHTVYRPPSSDLALFFKYENLLILGDVNIDLSDQTKIPKPKKEFLHELYDTYDLYNLMYTKNQ